MKRHVWTMPGCLSLFAGLVACTSSALSSDVYWDSLNDPGSGGHCTAIAVSPHDSRHLVLAGDVMGIGCSMDNGETWQPGMGTTCWEINDITFHPSDKQVVWAGTMGGPHKSTDGGLNWAPKRQGFPAITTTYYSAPIEIICFDPNDQDTLLAFGGSHRYQNRDRAQTRMGVWKSTDGGENWLALPAIDDAAVKKPDDGSGVNVQYAGFAAGSSSTLFACAFDDGVYRSTDGGASFAKVGKGLPHPETRYMALHPKDPNVLWVSLARGGWVYKSTDGGNSWQNSSNGMETGIAGSGLAGRRVITVSASNPDVLYTENNRPGGRIATYRSSDGGRNWVVIATRGNKSAAIGGTFYASDIYPSWLTVNPNDPDDVLLLNSELVLRSTDGGKLWRDLAARQVNGGFRGNGYSGMCCNNIVWNPYRPLQVFTLAMDGGKMRSNDGCWSWLRSDPAIKDQHNGANDAACSDDGTIYWALGQNRGEPMAKSTDWGKTWRYMPNPEGPASVTLDVHVDPADSRHLWVIAANNGQQRQKHAFLYESSDGGDSWRKLTLPEATTLYNIAADVSKGLPFYVAAQNAIYKTTDGVTFTAIPGSPSNQARNFVYLDPSDNNTIYVANFHLSGSGLWRYDGKWERILDKPLVRAVAIDPGNPRRLAVIQQDFPIRDVGIAEGVWLTEDGGQSWQLSKAGLRVPKGITIAFNPDKSGQLIFGTGGAGFCVTDWGTSTAFGGSARDLAGIIEAEDFDLGGEGIAYHDSSAVNQGRDTYRNEAVDIRTGGSGQVVTAMAAGEWLKYRVNVPASGVYDVTFGVACAKGGGQIHLTANGVNVTGPVALPRTGGAEKWSAVVARGVRLRGGEQFLKLYVEGGGADLDWMQFRPTGQ